MRTADTQNKKPQIIKIFLSENDESIEKINIPKGMHYQIINRKKGSIGQAYNYPKLVQEVAN